MVAKLDPRPLVLRLLTVLMLHGCTDDLSFDETSVAATEKRLSQIRLIDPDHIMSADDPEGQADAAAQSGQFKFILAHGVRNPEVLGIVCSIPIERNKVFHLGKYYVSDVPDPRHDEIILKITQFALRYNNAVVNHPQFPHKDICRARMQGEPILKANNENWSTIYDARFLSNLRPDLDIDPAGIDSLTIAARLGLEDRLRELIELSPEAIDGVDEFGLSPLAWSMARGNLSIAVLLLNEGAAVWPQHLASARISQLQWSLNDPVFLAVLRKDTEALSQFVAAHDQRELAHTDSPFKLFLLDRALTFTAMHNDIRAAKILFRLGARVVPRYPRHHAFDALWIASGRQHWEMVELLMAHFSDTESQTALWTAAWYGSASDLAHLIEDGEDPFQQNQYGVSLLYPALGSARDAVEKITLLVELGLDVNSVRNGGRTALMDVSGHEVGLQVMNILVESGADLEGEDDFGCTVLLIELQHCDKLLPRCDVSKINALLDHGADVEGSCPYMDVPRFLNKHASMPQSRHHRSGLIDRLQSELEPR